MFDDTLHPDLVEIDRIVNARIDRVLEVEQEAAAIAARRLATLRDRLLEVEDQAGSVAVHTRGGDQIHGVPRVALDHVEVVTASGSTLVPFPEIVGVELR